MIQHYIRNESQSILKGQLIPKLIHVCKIIDDSSKFPRAMHVHDESLEIVYICSGSGVHIIGNKVYQTKAGDLLIYNRGVAHDERVSLNNEMHYFCCGITNLQLNFLPSNCLLPDNISPVIHCDEYSKDLEVLFDFLYSYAISEDNLSLEFAKHIMMSILTLTTKVIGEKGSQIVDEQYELGQRIKNFIDAKYLENLTLSSLSESLGISQYYLGRVFKDKTGYSPMQYIINRRVGDAQSMLINTDYSITKIAELVGYDNPNYFNLLFKKTVGMPPGSYRKFIRNGKSPKKL